MMSLGKSCFCVQMLTPKRYLLNGLWFGAERPKTAIIFVHGLGSNAFAHHDYLTSLATSNSAVLFFSNRGHDGVAGIKKFKPSAKKRYVYEQAGVAHEVFTDCADDIQGAVNLLVRRGARRIYLVGHSTGCQKIAFYLGRATSAKRIAGAVLLCPISDYADAHHQNEPKRRKAEAVARKLVRRNRPHELLPAHLWRAPIDAQRFLSLYTLGSREEIFTYAQPRKIPHTLRKMAVPLLVVFAGEDEYRDRDTQQIAEWFRSNLRSKESVIQIIPGASHSLSGKEAAVARAIRSWIAHRS
ncbi:MAG: alpha/beta fold hydrolase [Candidatus Acidiferrales bacterium]